MRAIVVTLTAALGLGTSATAQAQTTSAGAGQAYPAKPVRVINPFAPGGGLDLALRPVLLKMSENLKQTFVMENRPGAAGVIGTDVVAKSPPDGYTLVGATTGTITINPSTYAKLPFDPVRDLAPVTNVGAASFVLVTHPSLAVNDVRELVALAKRSPGDLTLGSPGYGGINHVAGEYFAQLTGVHFTHVPFKGSAPMLADIMGGHVMLAFDSTQATLPHIRSGKLKARGIAAGKRSPIAPEIPTILEAGGPAMVVSSWYGLLAPAGTPRDIIMKLHAEAVKALAAPDLLERYHASGLEEIGSAPDEFAAVIREDTARWAKVVRAANIRTE
jgi:tripartite-type tricarboxylate transporter receptor subunit TctC